MYDLVINNGTIVDGYSDEKFVGSVGISGDKIIKIAKTQLQGDKGIDAKGLIISPGFIDLHTHSETGMILDNRIENKLFQGVTTDITGNCGVSLFPKPLDPKYTNEFRDYCSNLLIGLDKINGGFYDFRGFYEVLLNNKTAINCGALVGHGTLRICAMGFSDRHTTEGELTIMKNLLEKELEIGTLGMSFGLFYPPGSYASNYELIELAKILKKHNAILTAHIRDEGEEIFDSIQEIINIAKETGVQVHISHIKLMSKSQWGKAEELISTIRNAKNEGIKISCDQYPYLATSTMLSALVPAWVHEGGTLKMLERLNSNRQVSSPQIKDIISKRGGANRIKIAYTFGTKKEYEGEFLSKIANSLKLKAEEAVIKILTQCEGKVNAIYFSMTDEDVYCFLKNKNIVIASDGFAVDFENRIGGGLPHPRSFGTFPKFVRLCRDKNLLSIEDAIRKITSIPAHIFGLNNIGEIKEGKYADITIFDWDEFTDNATYENPFQKPSGLKYVVVSGKIVVSNGEITSNRPGRIIK